jgi:uncharacterized protein YwqG
MSSLRDEIERMIKGEDNLVPVRVSLALAPIKNARLEFVLEKISTTKQTFISNIIDAALYDIEIELGFRDTNIDILHTDNKFKHPLKKEFADAIVKIAEDKERQAKEAEEKLKKKNSEK